jgi:hypothetical protein
MRRELTSPVLCVRCKTPTRVGIVHIHDDNTPPSAMMCLVCYRTVVATKRPDPEEL